MSRHTDFLPLGALCAALVVVATLAPKATPRLVAEAGIAAAPVAPSAASHPRVSRGFSWRPPAKAPSP